MEIATRFQHPLEHGVVTTVCPSTHWIIVGTDSGTLSLWDLRFGLLLKSWRASGGITAVQVHPSRGKGRWIAVSTDRGQASDGPIVEVYDVETAKLAEMFEVRTTRPSSKNTPPSVNDPAEPAKSKAEYVAELAARREAINASLGDVDQNTATSSVMSLIVGQSFASLIPREDEGSMLTSVPESKAVGAGTPGWMVTAGEDRVVRYWDLAKVAEGFVICGSPKEKDVTFKWVYSVCCTLNTDKVV